MMNRSMKYQVSCSLLVFMFALMFVGSMMENVHATNNVEWKGTVFVNENVEIPSDSVLSIKDDAVIVFYSSISTTQVISISINGTIELGKNVQMMSLDFYKGEKPTPSFNTDMWGFVLQGSTRQLSLKSLTIQKTKNIGRLTFDIEQSMDSISMDSSLFSGGTFLFAINVGEHVFKVTNSRFEMMKTVLSVLNEENACQVMISNCSFTTIGNTFTHKGSDLKNAKNSFIVEDSLFNNVGQGVNSGNVALTLNHVTFRMFKSAVVSYSVSARNVDFDNTNVESSGVAIANSKADTNNGIFDVQNCQFRNIRGLVIFMNYNLKLLRFTNNKVMGLLPSSGLPLYSFNLIGGTLFNANSVIFEQNEITNCNANGVYSIVNFDNVENLSFTQNTFIGNSAKCSLMIKNIALLNSNYIIEQNIFDSAKMISGEVCIGQQTNIKVNVMKNYWGKKVDKSLNLPTKEMNEIIAAKLSPSRSFEFVPYYLTSNVSDNSASNLGGYVNPEPSNVKPSDSNLAIIIGSSIGGAVLILIIVIILAVVIKKSVDVMRKKAYSEI